MQVIREQFGSCIYFHTLTEGIKSHFFSCGLQNSINSFPHIGDSSPCPFTFSLPETCCKREERSELVLFLL